MSAEKIGAIILAAGSSTRLGEPKQFLRYRGESLIRRTARAAREARCAPVVVVAGAAHRRIADELVALEVEIVHNEDWQRGIGTSIRCGVEACLSREPALTAIAILVCDQPALDARIVSALRAKSERGIAAAAYSGTLGVPAVFTSGYFPELRALADDYGAKRLLQSHAEDVTAVPFPEGAIDIDTPWDLRRLHDINLGT